MQGADGEQQELAGDGGDREHGARVHQHRLQGEVALGGGDQAQGGAVQVSHSSLPRQQVYTAASNPDFWFLGGKLVGL